MEKPAPSWTGRRILIPGRNEPGSGPTRLARPGQQENCPAFNGGRDGKRSELSGRAGDSVADRGRSIGPSYEAAQELLVQGLERAAMGCPRGHCGRRCIDPAGALDAGGVALHGRLPSGFDRARCRVRWCEPAAAPGSRQDVFSGLSGRRLQRRAGDDPLCWRAHRRLGELQRGAYVGCA